MGLSEPIRDLPDTPRVADLRRRVHAERGFPDCTTPGDRAAAAGERLHAMSEDGACTVLDLTDEALAANKVVIVTEDPDAIARHVAGDGNRQWEKERLSYSSFFAFVGDRILMRSFDHLCCIRDRGK